VKNLKRKGKRLKAKGKKYQGPKIKSKDERQNDV